MAIFLLDGFSFNEEENTISKDSFAYLLDEKMTRFRDCMLESHSLPEFLEFALKAKVGVVVSEVSYIPVVYTTTQEDGQEFLRCYSLDNGEQFNVLPSNLVS